mmetsp:Transcript_78521/g.230307  ORF Transcript_78521/g.230307 Transcript_78521/m.230307 type:complete len:290 (+) Transcript_78521:800-1669(+)
MRLARSIAREEMAAGSISSPGVSKPPASEVKSTAGSMSGNTMSSTSSPKTCCMALGRTISKLLRAASKRDVSPPMPGILLLALSWYMERIKEAGPSLAHSSRSTTTNGSRHFSWTAEEKEVPRRTRLQIAPAARPQSRQFSGFSWRPRAPASSSWKGARFSLNVGKLTPAKHKFPSALSASSAGLCNVKPWNICSSASSMPCPPSSFWEASCAWFSSPGGKRFSFVSCVTTSRRSRRCGSGLRPANSAMALALMDLCDHSRSSSRTAWRHVMQESNGHTCLTAGAVSAQ